MRQALPIARIRSAVRTGSIVFLVAGTLYAATATRTITTRFGGADGAELAATAVSGGVAHPSGYPTYLLMARAALLLPWGEPAGRLALLSALCGALAAGCTAILVVTATRSSANRWALLSTLAGLYAGLTLALSPRIWSQAIIVEVYAANLCWLALTSLLLLLWLTVGRTWLLAATALCFGLGLGVHLTLLALLPAGILAWSVQCRLRLSWRAGIVALVMAAAGLAVYGFLPLWSRRNAVPSWGDQRTLASLWAHVSGQEYHYLVGIVPWRQRGSRLSFAIHDLLTQPGLVGVVLTIGWGLPHGWQRQRPLVLVTGMVALLNLLFAISYGAADGTVYLIPWSWAWCIWAGLGVEPAGVMLAALVHDRRKGTVLAGLILAAVLVIPLASRYPQLDLHADRSTRDMAVQRLQSLPREAALLTGTDESTFATWYVQHTLGLRPDVLLIDTRFGGLPWYEAQLSRLLHLPPTQSLCQALLTMPRPTFRLADDGSLVVEPSRFTALGCSQ